MAKLAPLLFLSALACAIAGCDGTPDSDGCRYAHAPELEPGSRSRCPSSTFPTEDPRAREVAGIVRRGEDVVAGALVRVEPWHGLATSQASVPSSTTTDRAGFFGGLRTAGLRYDLLVLFDTASRASSDVLVYRGAGFRFFEPAIEVEPRSTPSAWSAHLDVQLEGLLGHDQAVAFFASGDGVFGVTGDHRSGLTVYTRDYSSRVALHAIAYRSGEDLVTATDYGTVEVFSEAGTRRVARMRLDPIPMRVSPRFVASAPAGFSPSTVDVIIGFTRTSDARLATVPVGVASELPVVPNAGYTYRARAEHAGATSDTGESWFDVYQEEVAIALPAPPELEHPGAAEVLEQGEPLRASGVGVFEHLLEAEGGAKIRIVSHEHAVTVPDLEPLGLPRAAGTYRWRVRSFPSARYVEEISGIDARRYRPMAESAVRSIELR